MRYDPELEWTSHCDAVPEDQTDSIPQLQAYDRAFEVTAQLQC
jgi:hypothetical protein